MVDNVTTITDRNRKEQFSSARFRAYIDRTVGNLEHIDVDQLFDKITSGLAETMSVESLLEYSAEIAATNITKTPNYGILASRIELKSIYRSTPHKFTEAIENAKRAFKFSEKFQKFVEENSEALDAAIMHEKDENFDFFAIKTIKSLFLIRLDDEIFIRPQHLFMKVAAQIHCDDLEAAIESYHLMSSKYFTHATPTLINAGMIKNQMSSCFLHGIDDNVEGITDCIDKMCRISRRSGGLGIHISNLRAKGTIGLSNYKSKGIMPTIRVFNEVIRTVSQGNNRKSACAIYMELWHAEILSIVHLRKNTGPEDVRARDIFPSLMIPDIFMERVINNEDWSLFCPYDCPELAETYDEEFKKHYERHESEGKARKVMKARLLWKEIISSQIETGTPFMIYKDQVNRTSNHKNVGVIKSSNLCTEIVQYSDADHVAVCNLSSIALPTFVENIIDTSDNESNKENLTQKNRALEILKPIFNCKSLQFDSSVLKEGFNMHKKFENKDKIFNFEKLYKVTKIIVRNLNKVIDLNCDPFQQARDSNDMLRPIGIGIQGLADVFAMLHLPFESQEARELNRDIAETMYYAAIESSCELAEKFGHYKKYPGSPISEGKLSFDLNNVEPKMFDFTKLRAKIAKYGVRNSMLIALMPTATTSAIFNYNECFEPFTSNIYSRGTLSGDFQVVNKYLLNDLKKLGIWNEEMKNLIVYKRGSIQEIPGIPQNIKEVYKTVWEIKMRTVIDYAADRQAYICQSQSMNLFLKQPTFDQVNAMHIYGWKKGLKTGMYYMRTMPIGTAIQFTVDRNVAKKKLKSSSDASETCNLDQDCFSCGS